MPRLIKGGMVADKRGRVSFVNEFDFKGIKRFYMIENARVGYIRAWHGHKNEGKFILVAKGAALFGTVALDNWEAPSKDLEVKRFVINSKSPAVLCIPPGSAIGLTSLAKDTRIIIFSTSTLQESEQDDIRYDPHYWPLPVKKIKLQTGEI